MNNGIYTNERMLRHEIIKDFNILFFNNLNMQIFEMLHLQLYFLFFLFYIKLKHLLTKEWNNYFKKRTCEYGIVWNFLFSYSNIVMFAK